LVLTLTLGVAATAEAQDPNAGGTPGPVPGSRVTGAAQFGHRGHGRRGHRARHNRRHRQGTGDAGPTPVDTGAANLSSTPPAPGPTATIGPDGLASPPSGAPAAVVAAIQAGNKIIGKPYRYGGGHGSFEDSGYDCSGSISYALHGAHLVSSPLDSSEFESWGASGAGQWISVFANSGHAYMSVAGIRLDTSAADDPHATGESGPRWRPVRRSNGGYTVRHPTGL
jgi:cell wall-associated NlpC family hydrolase